MFCMQNPLSCSKRYVLSDGENDMILLPVMSVATCSIHNCAKFSSPTMMKAKVLSEVKSAEGREGQHSLQPHPFPASKGGHVYDLWQVLIHLEAQPALMLVSDVQLVSAVQV